MLNPIATNIGSFTTLFPMINELSGIVLMPYWSVLNAGPGRFDFSMIERALDFWSSTGRTVIVGLVTFGYPIQTEASRLTHPVPSWILDRAKTFRQSVPVIGPIRPLSPTATRDTIFPLYWDPVYWRGLTALIEAFSRFDGHPAISTIRICTGITGEDNPTFDGLADAMPGFTNAKWIKYTVAVFNLYRAAFRRSTLEFDIDRIGFIKSLGARSDRASADRFVRRLGADHTFLAMNGFDPTNVASWRSGSQDGPACSLRYVEAVKRGGGRVGLEGGGLDQLSVTDVKSLVTAIQVIGPERLVIFPDAVAALDRERRGAAPTNELSELIFGAHRLESLANKAHELFEGIGA